ncbi:hypothetical protein FIBSPDRAFT_872450 [Athelia psychrophila]|uniref:Uncharacterized protein n=1 Tax=Athelia psychrophila TaxID=1759441 RepID=A0A165ZGZ2_9AGAM|nr:hypothetical protein FIBSPDRAFT_872450 [Fibularhizoctonia sp. CBS 109695]
MTECCPRTRRSSRCDIIQALTTKSPCGLTQYHHQCTFTSSLGSIATGFDANMASLPVIIIWPSSDVNVTPS